MFQAFRKASRTDNVAIAAGPKPLSESVFLTNLVISPLVFVWFIFFAFLCVFRQT